MALLWSRVGRIGGQFGVMGWVLLLSLVASSPARADILLTLDSHLFSGAAGDIVPVTGTLQNTGAETLTDPTLAISRFGDFHIVPVPLGSGFPPALHLPPTLDPLETFHGLLFNGLLLGPIGHYPDHVVGISYFPPGGGFGVGGTDTFTVDVVASIPEPATFLLVGTMIVALELVRWIKRRVI